MNSYVITVGTFILIQAIAACGLNVIVGFAGQISLGHAAFVGIGAYSAAILSTRFGMTFWEALPCVIAISGSIGFLCGLPSIRVREDFLAITTIGVNFIVESVFLYVPFFGGALGIGGIPRIYFWGIRLKGASFFLLCLTFFILAFLLVWLFSKSWAGLGCISLREEETAASTVGISSVKYKLFAFILGTSLAGLSGALYAHAMRFISAEDFGFPASVMLLSIIVLGGMGTLWGPLVGAIILGFLPELFRPFAEYRLLMYALLLLCMIRYQPSGLLGENSLAKNVFGKLLQRRVS
ncbi:MAG TPA: branched-chain amino acid ABC transporter permease [Synergistaceae bacterium]|nr:branched-chain amino acid ABC transporter permease [Synergistaceae bacterium]HPJ24610.1 branched-chain amino acid ABC transporter permease [Synergistaceae bacterium]HPQ36195.1 branched-chain amino acid ABC transporter permease [Synergistaceae bacterium]